MTETRFIAVGENIHCTRSYKIDGNYVKELSPVSFALSYKDKGQECSLPIPKNFIESDDWVKRNKVRHTAVAIWQGLYGDNAAKQAAEAYIHHMVRLQEDTGAAFLDLNVDEFSTDVDERIKALHWAIKTIQRVSKIPLSIDSSNLDILKEGLEACDQTIGRPLLNSLSLERVAAIDIAHSCNAVVIAGATGENTMPSTIEDRLNNFEKLIPLLKSAGLKLGDIYLDPLIFPASVDPQNSKNAIEAVKVLREHYGPEVHFAPGLSNVSFGLPNRKLLNLTFTYLCWQAGCDGGIVDPRHINQAILKAVDIEDKGFKLAKAFLEGEDDFGMNYISATRSGEI